MSEQMKHNDHHGEDVQLIVTLLDGQGNPYDVAILNSFMYDGRQYVSAIPVLPDEKGNYDIYLFRAVTKEGNTPENVDVEFTTIPEDEYTAVATFYENTILPMDEDKIP